MIESDWIPTYAPEGFSAAALHAGESPAFGQLVSRHHEIQALPTAWDVEWEVFDKYRIPGAVFPLRVVVARDGTVVFKANDELLDETEAAIQDALAL